MYHVKDRRNFLDDSRRQCRGFVRAEGGFKLNEYFAENRNVTRKVEYCYAHIKWFHFPSVLGHFPHGGRFKRMTFRVTSRRLRVPYAQDAFVIGFDTWEWSELRVGCPRVIFLLTVIAKTRYQIKDALALGFVQLIIFARFRFAGTVGDAGSSLCEDSKKR